MTVLSGNLHQSQYCDKLKSIVEFLGPKLSMDELTTIWEMQVDKNPVQVCVSVLERKGVFIKFLLNEQIEYWHLNLEDGVSAVLSHGMTTFNRRNKQG